MSSDVLQDAQNALLKGDRERARQLLSAVIRENPRNEKAWLMLAGAVDTRAQMIYCLERVLIINRRNALARRWLVALKSGEEPDFLPFKQWFISKEQPPSLDAGLKLGIDARQPGKQTQAMIHAKTPSRILRGRQNWSLWIGIFIISIIGFLAIFGPSLAPRDPLEENLIIKVGEKWYIPPFDPLTPGFPLGSDEYGRDLFSRLLWAVRPTMMLVLIVATVRLGIGVLLGMLAGWSKGRLGHILETMIEVSLSVPALLVALGAIAIVGVELGIWAFVIGLSLTGWVDTAQQIFIQTRIISRQVYVEAARALGASRKYILFQHVLRQIKPMLLMLFAFEVSNTLMLTAGLGFLGYYIGGDVWIDVSDFVARRTSGLPELGQMLATSWSVLTKPWAMVTVGNTIFLAVLGFNLAGEGLRRHLQWQAAGHRDVLDRAREAIGLWIEQTLWYPLSSFISYPKFWKGFALGVLLIVCLVVGLYIGIPQSIKNLTVRFLTGSVSPIEILRGATEPDASTTRLANQPGIIWTYSIQEKVASNTLPYLLNDGAVEVLTSNDWLYVINPDGTLRSKRLLQPGPDIITGGMSNQAEKVLPIILPDDIAVVISREQSVYALDHKGEKIWEERLLEQPIDEPPTQAETGNIYIADRKAGLYAFDVTGLRFHFQSEVAPYTASGPIVDVNGTVYFVTTNRGSAIVQAISESGELLWTSEVKTMDFYESLQLSPDHHYLFLQEDVFSTQNGELISILPSVEIDRFIMGHDRHVYMLSGHRVYECHIQDKNIVIEQGLVESDQSFVGQSPIDVVVDENHIVWYFFGTYRGIDQIMWIDLNGKLFGKYRLPKQAGYISEADFKRTRYTDCILDNQQNALICEVHVPQKGQSVFSTTIKEIPKFSRGILHEGYAYFITSQNILYKVFFRNTLNVHNTIKIYTY